MSTKHIISTINVILALLVTFSTQLHYNQSETYQDLNEWSLETNLLEFNDDSNEQLLAFSKFLTFFHCSIPFHVQNRLRNFTFFFFPRIFYSPLDLLFCFNVVSALTV